MYQIYNKDYKEVLKNIKNNSIQLVVIDPPYRVTRRGNSGSFGGYFKEEIAKKGKIFKHNNVKVKEYAKELYRILENNKHLYVMTNNKNLFEILKVFQQVGFKFIKSLIWDKKIKIAGTFYMNQFEYILFFRKGKGVRINNCSTPDILSIKNNRLKDKNNKNFHNSEKPIELMEILIKNSSKENDIVLDCFMGLGTTGVASIKNNRKFIGCEIDKKYFEIAKKRLEKI